MANNKISEFASDIKSIAGTKELTESVKLALKKTESLDKELIKVKRSVGYQDGTGVKSGTGGNGSGDETTGTGANGLPVVAPLAPPVQSGVGNTTHSSTDAASNSSGLNNTAETGSTAANDLTDKAKEHLGGGGSEFLDQGLLGENNPDWLAIKQAKEDAGASDEEIGQARRNFLKKQLGIHEVGDVVQGNAGPKPDNSNSYPANHNTQPDDISTIGVKEVLNGVVGVNPTNHDQGILIRFDNLEVIPTAIDAANSLMNPWESAITAPIKLGYVAGYYWSNFAGNTSHYTGFNAVYLAAFQSGYPGTGHTIHYELDVTETVATPLGNYSGGSDIILGALTRNVCGGVTAYCPAEPPRETIYPLTGMFTLTYEDGHFTYSAFDSEVPLSYRGTQSFVEVHSMVTEQDYEVSSAHDGGILIRDTLLADGYFLHFRQDRTLHGPLPNSDYSFYKPRPQ